MASKQKPTYTSLKEWRAVHAFSTREAADLLSISQSVYTRLERGVRYTKGPLAKRIVQRTGVALESIVGVA